MNHNCHAPPLDGRVRRRIQKTQEPLPVSLLNSGVLGRPTIFLTMFPLDLELAAELGLGVCRRLRVIPVARSGDTLIVATTKTDPRTAEQISAALGVATEVVTADDSEFELVLTRWSGEA